MINFYLLTYLLSCALTVAGCVASFSDSDSIPANPKLVSFYFYPNIRGQ